MAVRAEPRAKGGSGEFGRGRADQRRRLDIRREQ